MMTMHSGKLKDWLAKDDAEFLQGWINVFFARVRDPEERSQRVLDLVMGQVMEKIGKSMKPNKADPKLVRAFKRDVRKNHGNKAIRFISDIDQGDDESELTLTLSLVPASNNKDFGEDIKTWQ